VSYTLGVGWFPRYSPDGSRLTWERPGYWLAQWFNAVTEIAQDGAHLVIGGIPVLVLGANELSAGGNFWAALRTDPVRVYTSDGRTILGAGCPTVNPDGLFGFVDDRQALTKKLLFNGGTVSIGAITDVRASRQALVWSDRGRTWGIELGLPGFAADIQAAPAEFRPIPIDTPGETWVGNHTDTGLVCRPFGSTNGYRFDNGGQCFYPDWKYANGTIVAIFTNDAGVQSEHVFPLDADRVPLGTAPMPIPPTKPQPPKPDPLPGPVPKPKPPQPEPWPRPPAHEEPMTNQNSNPSYDEFINGPESEALQIRAAYMGQLHHKPAIPDYFHWAWRRLRERWTLRDILHDIKGEPLEDGGAGGADPR
jgi:hypothetical protein